MKTALLVLCTFVASSALAAETPEFRLDEPISLDLKDAKVTEVITLLGAIAHLPVVIDPAIQGSVSIQLKDVPYSAALRKVSEPLGFTLKIEGGKLVAAPRRSAASPEARAAVAAGRLPDGPRVAVRDYRGAFKELSPLFVRWRSAGLDRCARVTFGSGSTFEADGTSVTQFGWEPVTRTRLIAIDGAEGLRAMAVGEPASAAEVKLRNDVGVGFQPPPNVPCAEAGGSISQGEMGTVVFRIEEVREDGTRVVISAPRIRARFGTAFSVRTGIAEPEGQAREVIVSGYLSGDGRSVAAAVAATAIRADSDGNEYVYVQSSAPDGGGPPVPIATFLLTEDEAVIASLGKGAALLRPVEVRVSRPEK
jgi:hypothetical protein